MIAIDILAIIILFSLFAISHSWLASRKLKKKLAEKIGNKIAFYRIFYNVSSVFFFIAFYELSPKPDLIIYELQPPFDLIIFTFQILSLFGLIISASKIDIKEFLGINQIERFFDNNYQIDDLDEKHVLKIEGTFKLVRHPIYMFSILFLGLRAQMSLFYLVMFISVIIYFYIGSILEEKKLLEIFGEEYRQYQKRVPRIFPIKIF